MGPFFVAMVSPSYLLCHVEEKRGKETDSLLFGLTLVKEERMSHRCAMALQLAVILTRPQGAANEGPGPNPAMPIHLHIDYGCFPADSRVE